MARLAIFRALIGIATLGGWACTADAVVVEATFTGEVTFLDTATQAAGAPFDQIQLGDPFVLRYRFDSETPNLGPGSSIGDSTGRYAILEAATTIGPFQSTVMPSGPLAGQIAVTNGSAGDSYRVGAELPENLLAFELAVAAILEDSSGAAHGNSALPTGVELADFDSAVLRLGQAGRFIPPAMPRLFVEGRILAFESRIVPEPSALWLALAVAGGAIAGRRRWNVPERARRAEVRGAMVFWGRFPRA